MLGVMCDHGNVETLALQARRAEVDRNTYLMIRNERISLVLNIGGMLAYIALFVAIITVIIVMEGQKIMAYEPQS